MKFAFTPRMRRCGASVLGAALGLLLPCLPMPARAQFAEPDVKAAFLLNFTKFVSWPPAAFAEANSPFTIGILGDDRIGSAVDKAARGQSVGGRRVEVRRSRSVADLKGCQLVFLGKAEVPGSLQGAVLTVGEGEAFARQGGMIGFTMEGDNVRFVINTSAARRARVVIKSGLLKLAKSIVE